ncbi:MAG TPA: hypothetical protein VLT33_13975 [Labilithrix sp.]|nr:hypothetical protein [Labilithrix sp.]
MKDQDYWELPQIDAGTFKKEHSYVLALTGCRGDSTLTPGKECGPGFTAGGGAGIGNLKVQIFETNTTPVSATQLGVQVFHLSAQLDAVFGPGAANPFPVTPGFVTNPDGGVGFKAASAAPLELHKLTPVQGVTGVTDANLFVLNKTSPSVDPLVASHSLAPFPLPFIQALSGLGLPTAPTVYKDGANYVFVAIGDPAQPTFSATHGTGPGDGGDGTVFTTRSVHDLAFPTDPVIEPYKP